MMGASAQLQQPSIIPPPQQAAPTIATAPESYELIKPKEQTKEELPSEPDYRELAQEPDASGYQKKIRELQGKRRDIETEKQSLLRRVESLQQVFNEVQENGKVDSAATMLGFKHMKGRIDEYMKDNPTADYEEVFKEHLNELKANFGKHPDNGRPVYPDGAYGDNGYDQRSYRKTF